MENLETEDIDYITELKLKTTVVRIIDKMFIPCTLRLKAELFINPDSDPEQTDLALTKIKYWFEHIVSRCIIFDHLNSFAINALIKDGKSLTTNILMVTPRNPNDQHLAELFQCKLAALSAGHLGIGMVEITSDNVMGLTFTFIGSGFESLPTIEQWVGKIRYFDDPWWARDDSSTLDIQPNEDADLTIKPAFAQNLDFLGNIMNPSNIPQDSKIIKTTFKPKIINPNDRK
jgi:hypothetical protein